MNFKKDCLHTSNVWFSSSESWSNGIFTLSQYFFNITSHLTLSISKWCTVNSPQQPDDFLATYKTLGRLLSPIFSISVFTICSLLFSFSILRCFIMESLIAWVFMCGCISVLNSYVLIVHFYIVLNVVDCGFPWLLSIVFEYAIHL